MLSSQYVVRRKSDGAFFSGEWCGDAVWHEQDCMAKIFKNEAAIKRTLKRLNICDADQIECWEVRRILVARVPLEKI